MCEHTPLPGGRGSCERLAHTRLCFACVMVLRLVEVVRVKTIPSKAGEGWGGWGCRRWRRGGMGSVMDGGKRDER